MGDSWSAICKTCKTEYYLIHGGSESHKRVTEKFNRIPMHQGHDIYFSTLTYTQEKNGELWTDVACFSSCEEDEIIVPEWGDYRHVNMSGEDLEGWEKPSECEWEGYIDADL